MTNKLNANNLNEFVNYCREFYDEKTSTLYPFASEAEIRQAAIAHLTDPNPLFPFDGDSADREAVRERIIETRRVTGFGMPDFDTLVRLNRMNQMANAGRLA
jgi:hypothetical protein